ncbi:LURP1-related protein domain containing protein [Heracleum sosnowskyi]|uniref:LURP1-related protein domain containing protein n=1 Tax=Heracleum sosnowskyi TaxID=360622 RepID=A0AAD8H1X0_9APIA|nr:LURP1-related protein domain containing protein [Heracleum sosnowskyi]
MKKSGIIIDGSYIYEKETQLTVRKTCLFFPGDGFTVYDCSGQLVFRVDTYATDASHRSELVLMDPSGRCLLTVRRKRPSLHQRWEGFLGERVDGQKPIFSVRRSSIIGRSSVTVEMYNNPGVDYQIEGSYAHRCCTIYDMDKKSVGEIKRKVDCTTNVVLGKDVFSLFLKPGFDGAFAMGLVLVLDQINGDDHSDDDSGPDVDTASEDSHKSS